ncbi:MAG: esterase-like activity of phytase family protein [Rhodobacteraceae bacterium]|nr:esterase-like activity of phytase family protein [Paracoccaceae bacterium]
MRRSFAVQLATLILVCTAALAEGPTAEYLGSFRWRVDKNWFGGFSGLEMSSDGQGMTIISDRGKILTAQIKRKDGKITAIIPGKPRHLKSSDGKRLSRLIADSEGLAIAPDGTIYISFEGVHRVSRYAAAGGRATPLHRPKAFRTLPINGSLEALAIDQNGRLYTLPEDALNDRGQIPVYRWANGQWTTPFTLPAKGKFHPVAADFGPDGRFYLLERSFSILGFRTRLRRWDITDTAALHEQTLLETGPGTHDNLEGLSIWRDSTGELRATMISDDNFKFFQRTELVEYALTK